MYRDTDIFLEHLRPHYNDAVKYCRALTFRVSIDDAEDLFQQSVLKGLENFPKLIEKEKFKSWFFKIITNEFINQTRRAFWRKFLPMDENVKHSKMPEIYEQIEQTERNAALYKALSELSSKERICILLFELAEFSIEEIRKIQNEKSLSAVKSRLSRARSKLRERITEIELSQEIRFKKINPKNLGDLENETLKLISEFKHE
ncbi:MAG: RNA polymerase sigma factor [Ignavibacteria bacterium]|nr:RNA polymerase sigma factor [Ignavibacteria bacterium]